MRKKLRPIDKVRASRDGHEFHEAWAARKALQLVMPTDGFVGLAVEGLAPADQKRATTETIEIADLVFYYGKRPTFDWANSVVIAQVKYSMGSKTIPYRASEAKKTIQKFAAAYKGYKRNHGAKDVQKKLTFELITNRPVHPDFRKAIEGLASGAALTGDAKKQARQFKTACGFKDKDLVRFAQKVTITALSGSLRHNKQQLSRVLADWSVAPDAMARARLGAMRHLLREKAGLAGTGNNVITQIDVLDALELQGPEDLLPCPASFPEVGKVVEREQLEAVIRKIPGLNKPLLVHADGGVGKTVFIQSLAKALSKSHETVLFDCFGGGAYRAKEDARHLPARGLVHIANKLACDGLCDPLLPNNGTNDQLIKAFRARLSQAVAALQRGSRGKQLLLFIDAIDNAAEHANDKGETPFPKLILESFHHVGAVPGVQLIVSCRTHRRNKSKGTVPCEEIQLKPFSTAEAEKYLRDRVPKLTETQVLVAYSRSQGNPRILEHLALSDRGLLDASEIANVIKLDDLLKARITKALDEALKRGHNESDINAFLAGLSVLPPPVPLVEYADAHGMELGAIKSFAVDLAPLLEQTKHGLMFRDEPTETLVRESYASDKEVLHLLAKNLLKKQDTSVYAATALPGLLQKLDDGKLLFELAFDERFPNTITSTVGKQNIRYARLKASVLHASRKADFDRLVHLLVELSTLAAVNERGTDYILENPDLAIASNDIDATRRLFETRTGWPGTRHARLTIARLLSGDLNDAYRHAVNAEDWFRHYYEQNEEYRREKGGPERQDFAAIPLCIVAQGRGKDAARFMKGWKDWYAYEIAEHIFNLLGQARTMEAIPRENIEQFLDALKSQAGMLAAALSFFELDTVRRRKLIEQLASACKKTKTIEMSKDYSGKQDRLIRDGLMKSAAIATSMNLDLEASAITSVIPHERPSLYSFMDRYMNKEVFPFIAYTALSTAIARKSISEHLLLPKELVIINERVASDSKGEVFRKLLKGELEKYSKAQEELPNDKRLISYEEKRRAERFIDERLEPLLEIAQAITAMLSSRNGQGDKPFLYLIAIWEKLRKKREHYSESSETNLFFDVLGRQLLMFSLWSRKDLKVSSVETFVTKMSEDAAAHTETLIEVCTILSKRSELQELAGKTALKAKRLIENEDEVVRRASLFAQLSRAIMPASVDETASYFRAGLEQMDVIGSGDYQFTNELLIFAGQLKGDELEEIDIHTLSNICELNMPSEEEKFPWSAFAYGLSRTSGLKTLAKLGRWDDRNKVSLNYTLLPYLSALIEEDKIDPALALALLRLSDPAELHVCGTKQLAEVLVKNRYPNTKDLIAELIFQFEQNHPGSFMPDTFATLSRIAETEFGKDSLESIYLASATSKFEQLRNEHNDHRNYHGPPDQGLAERKSVEDEKNRRSLKTIANNTDPTDEASMARAIDALNDIQHIFDLKAGFFDSLRAKVKFGERLEYVQIIAGLENLDIYTKLSQLKLCKEQWGVSSASIEEVFKKIALPVIRIHADDFVSHDYLSGFNLKEIADLSSIPMPELALELITVYAAPDSHLPASVWMSLAAIICQRTTDGEGQKALSRLLKSNSAKLASTVVDGPWKNGMYPTNGQAEIAAGLVWLTLGSPHAAYRWRAAHSIRCFARFGKWDVIDALVARFHSMDAHPYQAPELPFFFLHARLWFLIAIARLAIDHPQNVAKYADKLKAIAFDKNSPHILMRHFASKAVLTCSDSGSLTLKATQSKSLRAINHSSFPRKTTKKYPPDSFYQSRPDSIPEPESEFSLDYDFDKTDVGRITNIFDRSRWETKDAITLQVRKYDTKIASMYEYGGRTTHYRQRMTGMSPRYHTYGQQLGWHALYLVAGEFLQKHPVVQRPYDDEDSWLQWLGYELLTRQDGLWLADGIDKLPLDTQVNLYEKGEKSVVLTSDRNKLLSLLAINGGIAQNVVVAGSWHSADNIGIHIGSALAPSTKANNLAVELSQKDPFQAWLPIMQEYELGHEFSHSEQDQFKPWIVWPSTETRLDETDPLGADCAVRRLHFTKTVNAIAELKTTDPFCRKWVNGEGKVMAQSEAWGRNRANDEDEANNGNRLICNTNLLRQLLTRENAELLLLIILRRYDRGYGNRDSQYWHTTAVVRIKKSLEFEYYAGRNNELHVMKY